MIIYIHGFASCGQGDKANLLKQHFSDRLVLSPDLPVEPRVALQQLQALIDQHGVSLLVGSSLGGYYADVLNTRQNIPSVLINPATRPFEALSQAVGQQTNWCTGKPFEWKVDYLQQLKKMYRPTLRKDERYLVLLQSDDDLLDYRLARDRYADYEVVVGQGGGHRLENLLDYLPMIDRFIKAS